MGTAYRFFNQIAETHRVRDLAALMKKLSPAGSEVVFKANPRNEKAENDLTVKNENYRALGWEPILLDDGKAKELVETVVKHKDRLNENNINPSSFWTSAQQEAQKEEATTR